MDDLNLSFLLMVESDIPDLTSVMARAFDDDNYKAAHVSGEGVLTWIATAQANLEDEI